MKQLLITIAALVLVGCGESQQSAPSSEAKTVKPAAEATDHSGTYILSNADKYKITLNLKTDGFFTGMLKGLEGDKVIGSWKAEGELLICEGTTEKSSKILVFKFNKTTWKWISLSADGEEMPIEDIITEGEDGLYLKKLSQAESQLIFREAAELIFREAVEEGNLKAVKQHLADGTNLNAKDYFGMTPLMAAIEQDHKEIAELLIGNGADVNTKDDQGWTPLYHAVLEAQKEIAELLIAKGADVNAMDRYGGFPLYHAAIEGHKEIAELLIAKGADVNAKNDISETPLDGANKNNKSEIADLLRKHGGKTAEELKAEGK